MSKSRTGMKVVEVAVEPLPLVIHGSDIGGHSWWKSCVRCKKCSKEQKKTVYLNSNGKVLICRHCGYKENVKND